MLRQVLSFIFSFLFFLTIGLMTLSLGTTFLPEVRYAMALKAIELKDVEPISVIDAQTCMILIGTAVALFFFCLWRSSATQKAADMPTSALNPGRGGNI